MGHKITLILQVGVFVLCIVVGILLLYAEERYFYFTDFFFPDNPAFADRVLRKYNSEYKDLGVQANGACVTGCWDSVTQQRKVCLPDYWVLGITKCATTSFYYMLRDHPQITQYTQNEEHWFSNVKPITLAVQLDLLLDKNYPELSERQYNATRLGTHSPGMFWRNYFDTTEHDGYNDHETLPVSALDATVMGVRRYLPCVKKVVLLRDPAARAFSHFVYFAEDDHANDGDEMVDISLLPDPPQYDMRHTEMEDFFHEWVVLELQRLRTCVKDHATTSVDYTACFYAKEDKRMFWAVQLGVYSVFFRMWLNHFPLDHFFIADLSPPPETDYQSHLEHTLEGLEAFLEIDPYLSLPEQATKLVTKKSNART
jgi:hypothetical protein